MSDECVVACECCGCLGNRSCGHEIMDTAKCCTLNEVMICPCCVIANGPSHLRQHEDHRQLHLIAEGEGE